MLIEGPCTACAKDEPIVYSIAGDDTHPFQNLCAACAKDKLDELPSYQDPDA